MQANNYNICLHFSKAIILDPNAKYMQYMGQTSFLPECFVYFI